MNKTIENIASFWRLEAKLEDNNKYFYFYDEVQDILADTLKNYIGTLLIVSHDEQFVQDVGITRIMLIKN